MPHLVQSEICTLAASKGFNLEIIAHLPIQETVYKISKYMTNLTLITSRTKCALTSQNGDGAPACVI